VTSAKLQPTRLVATEAGDIQKLNAATGEVLTTIPAERLDRLRKATDVANLHERAARYGNIKHAPADYTDEQCIAYSHKQAPRKTAKRPTYWRQETVGHALADLASSTVLETGKVFLECCSFGLLTRKHKRRR
jgi:hypothetical protein